ncbi:MAG: molybdopterin-guanine dinucleotide biosynthesis protein B [Ectothiorhodospiraceae bacterium]|nr:molybdopterin-guanine dinucleotide biosynthesis protein B [Ectothiorhodospiraceae bacterium]
MTKASSVPVLGFVAPSGTGKTTLLTTLISTLKAAGIRVGVIKHSHHDFEIDKPGKDSFKLRAAGANQMLIASRYRSALITESIDPEEDVTLQALLVQLDHKKLDLILVEGFKHEHYAKIELFRAEVNKTPLAFSDPDIIAVATDAPQLFDDKIDCLDINDIEEVFQFILCRYQLARKK